MSNVASVIVYFYIEAVDQNQVQQLIGIAQTKVAALATLETVDVEALRSPPTKYHLTFVLRPHSDLTSSMVIEDLMPICRSGFSLPNVKSVYIGITRRWSTEDEAKARSEVP